MACRHRMVDSVTLIVAILWSVLLTSAAHADFVVIPIIIGLQQLGVGMWTAIAIGPYVAGAALTAGAAALQYALSPRPNLQTPKPESGQLAQRQAIAPRTTGYGRNRIAGIYVLYEAVTNTSWDILAFHAGRIASIAGYYLNDDRVTVDDDGYVNAGTDGRYGGPHRVQFQTRRGQDAETAYSDAVAALPDIWTDDHRGDGLASYLLKCVQADIDHQLNRFPNGLPSPSVVAECKQIWDPRDPDQDPDDKDSWVDYPDWSAVTTYGAGARCLFNGVVYYSRTGSNLNHQPDLNVEYWCRVDTNPVLQAIDYLTDRVTGRGHDRDILITPVLDRLIEEANICDELVAKKDGTYEPRYVSNGFYTWDVDEATTMNAIMATCDGWWAEQVDGSLAIWVGKYREPTVTIEDRHILGYSVAYGQVDEQSIDELLLTYTSEDADFKTAPGESLRNESVIARKGVARSQSLDLAWVRSYSQARRLQKRAAQRVFGPVAISLTTKLYGLRADGERWIRINYAAHPALVDAVVEVQPGGSYDLTGGRCAFNLQKIDPDSIDKWNPALEEGTAPPIPDAVTDGPMPVPEELSAFFRGSAADGFAIVVRCLDPGRDDLTYSVRYRVKDAGGGDPGPWQTNVVSSPPTVDIPQDGIVASTKTYVELTSIPVDANQVYEAEIAFRSSGGTLGDYAGPSTVAPAKPVDVATAADGPETDLSWTNPGTGNLAQVSIRRAADASLVNADIVETRAATVDAADSYGPLTIPGYYFLVALDADGNESENSQSAGFSV